MIVDLENLDCYTDAKGKEICRELIGHEEIRGQQVPVFRYWTRTQLDKLTKEQERKLRFEKQGKLLPGFERSILDE